ncbi:hypothetical protein PG999_003400 [Apiospora kogelbergensis]|uniref:Uncharacterized protein n=1 Tax=Apiospora kogelbergensis TaxID=1337665 RepID=A0AAW0R3K5_9PEZI
MKPVGRNAANAGTVKSRGKQQIILFLSMVVRRAQHTALMKARGGPLEFEEKNQEGVGRGRGAWGAGALPMPGPSPTMEKVDNAE